MLERLPAHFEQQPLLRIEARRLARGDPEEARVEERHVLQEAAVLRVHLARRVRIRVEVVVEAPPVRWDLGDGVHAVAQQAPESLGIRGVPGHAAAHPDDGDRRVRVRRRSRGAPLRRRGGLVRDDLPDQDVGERAEAGVIEGEGRRQRVGPPEADAEAVLQREARQRVEAEFRTGPTSDPAPASRRGRGAPRRLAAARRGRRSAARAAAPTGAAGPALPLPRAARPQAEAPRARRARRLAGAPPSRRA